MLDFHASTKPPIPMSIPGARALVLSRHLVESCKGIYKSIVNATRAANGEARRADTFFVRPKT